jgi:hypothetical protein
MLRAVPTAWYSSTFRLLRDDAEVGRLKLAAMKEAATFSVKDVAFEMYREGFAGDFVLAFHGNPIARADKPSVLDRRFVLTVETRRYVLESESAFRRAFRLRSGDGTGEEDGGDTSDVLGRIAPEGMLTRCTTVDLPDDLPLPVQAFCLWLVLVLWNRAAAAASG